MPERDADLGEAVSIYAKSEEGLAFFGTCKGTPPTTANEFAVGAIFVDVINKILYLNDGTSAVPTWTTVYDSDNAPAYDIVAAGEFTTVGGDADETITVTGALATDIVIVNVHTAGSTPRTVVDASASAGQIDVDMSGDPSTDHVLSYVVLRATA